MLKNSSEPAFGPVFTSCECIYNERLHYMKQYSLKLWSDFFFVKIKQKSVIQYCILYIKIVFQNFLFT